MSAINVDTIRSRTGTAPQLDKGAEVTVGVGLTGAGGVNIAGFATAGGFVGDLTGTVTGVATGLTGNPNLGTGVTVYATGIVSATSFYGDGANLTNITSGVDLRYDGNTVGSAITAINFSGFSSVTAPTAGLSTVTAAWGQEDAWLFGG
jgi:hypothetical protein